MTDDIQAVLDRLEFYEAVHPDPVPVQRIAFSAQDRELLQRKVREYEDALTLVRNAKVTTRKPKNLIKLGLGRGTTLRCFFSNTTVCLA